MFPADRQPIPVYVTYDCRGTRARRWFANGMGRKARAFYAAKLKAGKRPKVVRDDAPNLFDPPPTAA